MTRYRYIKRRLGAGAVCFEISTSLIADSGKRTQDAGHLIGQFGNGLHSTAPRKTGTSRSNNASCLQSLNPPRNVSTQASSGTNCLKVCLLYTSRCV